jgi:hypothetical protein
MPKRVINIIGKTFNRLTVLAYDSRGKYEEKYLCECRCLNRVVVLRGHLLTGHTQSCGCLQRERCTTHGLNKTPMHHMYTQAKYRAKKFHLPFSIRITDITIPETCPLLGIALKVNRGHMRGNSPTLDRIISDRGYVPGNIWVVSNKANVMKNSASLAELKILVKNLEHKMREKRLG